MPTMTQGHRAPSVADYARDNTHRQDHSQAIKAQGSKGVAEHIARSMPASAHRDHSPPSAIHKPGRSAIRQRATAHTHDRSLSSTTFAPLAAATKGGASTTLGESRYFVRKKGNPRAGPSGIPGN